MRPILITVLSFAWLLLCIAALERSIRDRPYVRRARAAASIRKVMPDLRRRRETERSRPAPEIVRLRSLLDDLKKDPSCCWGNLLAIADIYRKGAFPRFLPDEEVALECYKIVATCPDGEIAGLAQARYVETRTETTAVEDRAGTRLPREYGWEACRIAASAVRDVLPYLASRPREIPRPVREPVAVPTTPVVAYMSDSQNVHDHSVVQTTKENVRRLQGEFAGGPERGLPSKSTPIKDRVRGSILEQESLTESEKYDALEVLESLNDHTHSGLGLSEVDALSLMWKKIESSSSRRADLEEMLGRQLASGIENGHVVCSTGKIGRIMGTLDGVVDTDESGLETARPVWAIKEELASLAAKVRDEHERLGKTDEDDMRRDYERRAREEYVEKLAMNPSIIDPIVLVYSSGF